MRSLILFFLLLLTTVSASAQVKYTDYVNGRFEFSIEYPSSLLKPQPPPENGDGLTFLSADKRVEMRAWGQMNALDRSLREEFVEAKRQCGKKFYERLGATEFVVSCIKGGRIIYQKTVYRASDDVFISFLIKYPLRDKNKFDPIVTRIAKSMRHDLDAG